ncbi:MAG: hypothetical protein H6Q90_1502 [Deltaproteobacteria bacterium]|nr:hypothetical protein [Deltaproteobacteria bacterium]
MLWLVAALAIGAAATLGVLYARRRRIRPGSVIVPADLAPRVKAATRAFTKASSWQPASASDAPETAAAIEAALIAREPLRALTLAETALATTPGGAVHHVWLGWALCASGQPTAALDQLAQAQARGVDNSLAAYIAARAEHLKFEHASGAQGPIPPLVTTGDLAVVTLGRGRGGAAWLTGTAEVQLSAAEVKAAMAEHREVTARCLARALIALEREPGFVDAAYLVARLAVKAGFLIEATALFDAIAPRMIGRPEVEWFERDRADLADPAAAVKVAKTKPVSATAKRSRSLKVL